MDWETAHYLAPIVLGFTIYAYGVIQAAQEFYAGRYYDMAAWLVPALGSVALVGIYMALTSDYSCVWEGFADGPLPVECRQ